MERVTNFNTLQTVNNRHATIAGQHLCMPVKCLKGNFMSYIMIPQMNVQPLAKMKFIMIYHNYLELYLEMALESVIYI